MIKRLFLTPLLFSCTSLFVISTKTQSNPRKELLLLKSYVSRQAKHNDKIVISYDSLNLIETRTNNRFDIFLNSNLVVSGLNNISYMFQVFNNRYLLISYTKNSIASGQDLFERDSVCILDTKFQQLRIAHLYNIKLVQSKETMIDNYHFKTEAELKLRIYRYCAIDSIDLENNVLYLLNQNLKKEQATLDSTTIPHKI